MHIDPTDPRPPSKQIASDLREQITSGQLAPGAKLPSERVLTAQYGVAPQTVRQALAPVGSGYDDAQVIEMVSGYDEFSDRAFPDYPGTTSRQRWHRDLLRRAMEAGRKTHGSTAHRTCVWLQCAGRLSRTVARLTQRSPRRDRRGIARHQAARCAG